MKESDIRDNSTLKKYQKLVDKDVKTLLLNKKNLKKINYKAWGCKNVKKIFIKKNFSYFQCLNTKTIFANPRPKPEILEKFYSNSKSSNYWLNNFFLPKLKSRTRKIIKPRIYFLLNNFKNYRNKRFLDVGAGSGIFLNKLKKKWPKGNFNALEPSKSMADQCKKKNIDVYESTIEQVRLKKNKFDVITCFELFEHLYDPKLFLKKIYKMLNKNGIFYFTTLNGLGFDIQMLGKLSNSIYPPYHINFFNPQSIEVLLKKIGFKIILIDTPGKLDFNIVENNLSLLQGSKKAFANYLSKNLTTKEKFEFQNYLTLNKLSSHMRVVVKK